MSKDILQLIGNYLKACEFCKLKNLYGLSSKVYLKNLDAFNDIFVEYDHEFMDEIISQNRITKEHVIKYAVKYDIAKYVKLRKVQMRQYYIAEYEHSYISVFGHQIFERPKIVEHNYKYNKFRFRIKDINFIFRENKIALMKIIQHYPQKSGITIQDYHRQGHKDLWQLNYKHKIGHILIKHQTRNFAIMTLINSCVALHTLNRVKPLTGFTDSLMWVVLCHLLVLTPFYVRNKVQNLKLPL